MSLPGVIQRIINMGHGRGELEILHAGGKLLCGTNQPVTGFLQIGSDVCSFKKTLREYGHSRCRWQNFADNRPRFSIVSLSSHK